MKAGSAYSQHCSEKKWTAIVLMSQVLFFELYTITVNKVTFANFRGAISLLQPLRWRCVDCVIHHEPDVRKEQQYIFDGANKQ